MNFKHIKFVSYFSLVIAIFLFQTACGKTDELSRNIEEVINLYKTAQTPIIPEPSITYPIDGNVQKLLLNQLSYRIIDKTKTAVTIEITQSNLKSVYRNYYFDSKNSTSQKSLDSAVQTFMSLYQTAELKNTTQKVKLKLVTTNNEMTIKPSKKFDNLLLGGLIDEVERLQTEEEMMAFKSEFDPETEEHLHHIISYIDDEIWNLGVLSVINKNLPLEDFKEKLALVKKHNEYINNLDPSKYKHVQFIWSQMLIELDPLVKQLSETTNPDTASFTWYLHQLHELLEDPHTESHI